jgi:hypothetical protein
VLGQIPIGEQSEFTAKQGFIVRRQNVGLRGELPVNQGVDGLHVEVKIWLCQVVRQVRIDDFHHGFCAQISEQHEALGFVPSQNIGHLQTGLRHQTGNIDKGFAVFLGGWGVHDDQTCSCKGINPEISPKTGVYRGGSQGFH